MKLLRTSVSFFATAIVAGLIFAAPVAAQQGQTATAFAVSDFSKLRWLAGSWEGSAPGESSIFERYRFVDDSTAEITYYRDASFAEQTSTGRLYLSVGRVYHTYGPSRWVATHVGGDGVFFTPQTNTRNSFSWTYDGPDMWTATMRTGVSGRERVTVYHMKRVKR
jgi:hypothetical protein